MRYILRRPERESNAGDDVRTLTLEELRADPGRWREAGGRLAVRLAPGDAVEALADAIPYLAVVAIEFPSAGEGRGYSAARMLRERLGFDGELRAVGAGVRQDQLFLMARCGFDAFELAPGEDPEAARRALERYDVAYQPGSSLLEVRQQRFLGPRA
jgi:uncharacterized protein (DUF934 family)